MACKMHVHMHRVVPYKAYTHTKTHTHAHTHTHTHTHECERAHAWRRVAVYGGKSIILISYTHIREHGVSSARHTIAVKSSHFIGLQNF